MKIHLDLDCYFVSAERLRYPFLRDKPVVVAKGSDKSIFANVKKEVKVISNGGCFSSSIQFRTSHHTTNIKEWKNYYIGEDGYMYGTVITKSYEAKKYGIKTGTLLRDAFVLCPHLIVVPSDHSYYQDITIKLKDFLLERIPLLEQYSIDEFFGDLGGWIDEEDTFSFITNLQKEIMDTFGLPISIGASKSKWIAKLITDQIKPYGVKVVKEEQIYDYTKNIAIDEFPGIGRTISKKLGSYYIETLAEARRRPMLFSAYGKTGNDLYKRICGTDNEKVLPYASRKGIGISRSFKGIVCRGELKRRIAILSRYLSYSILRLDLRPTTFYFKLRYQIGYKSSCSITVNRLFNEKFFIELAQEQFLKLDVYKNTKVHFLSMSVSNFEGAGNRKTLSVLDSVNDVKYRKLSEQLQKIREKYGIDSIWYGSEGILSSS